MTVTLGRTYAGQSASERAAERRSRLLEAGLDLLGGGGGISVRKVIERSGLAPRYFYDNFVDIDALQIAIFDVLLTEAETRGLAALESSGPRPRDPIHAVLSEMVAFLLDDPRKGRVLLVESLGSAALGPRRAAELQRFAGLLATYSPSAWRGQDPGAQAVRCTTMFAMGGFAELLGAVLQGRLEIERTALVNNLTELFVGAGVAFRRMNSQAAD